MDRLHLMRVFVAVVDAGGLAGAARALKLSPPAVTRAVAELEQRIGVRLLTRTTRVVRVTEAGAGYVEDCRRILAAVDAAEAAAGSAHAALRGHLSLTAPVLFGRLVVVPIVVEYLEANPQVRVSCRFVDRIVSLVDEGIDAAIRIGELPDSSLKAVRVGGVRRVVCASPAYLSRCGTPQRPADLASHTVVSASAVTPMPEWRFAAGAGTHAVKLEPRLSVSSNDAAIAAALAGFGLTQVLSYQVAAHVQSGALRIVLAEHELPPLPVHLVHHAGPHAPRKLRAFVDLAVARLRAQACLASESRRRAPI